MVRNELCSASRRALKGYNEIKSRGSFGKNIGAPACHNARGKGSACVSTSMQRPWRCDVAVVQGIQTFV